MMKFIPQVFQRVSLNWPGIALLSVAIVGMFGLLAVSLSTNSAQQKAEETSYIVQGKQALQAVSRVGGQITHNLNIINAVAANLNSVQIEALKQLNFKLTLNTALQNDGLAVGQRIYFSPASATQMTNASVLHDARVFGDGVTMVVLDSGVKSMSGLRQDAYGRHRVYGTYNAIENKISQNDDEESGHGTHVASVALNSERDINGNFYGVAPNTRLISVKAFDRAGKGNYADVIRGIQWSIYYRERYNIRVMNLSFSTEARSYYWDDPLNQAVMKAWQSGIVV
ncbi:MAG: S8 family serine peptidase, partial [Kangiellaceae bacterium]|nr:S8 family serine peptidase [Kangiellaceae bacterium]